DGPFSFTSKESSMNIRRKPSYLAIVPALGLAFALSAQAAGDSTDRSADRTSAQQAQSRSSQQDAVNPRVTAASSFAASKLSGMELTNRDNEDVGEIKDLVVDTSSGEVRYAVVAFGGFLGLGEKHFAYPMARFEPPSAN